MIACEPGPVNFHQLGNTGQILLPAGSRNASPSPALFHDRFLQPLSIDNI